MKTSIRPAQHNVFGQRCTASLLFVMLAGCSAPNPNAVDPQTTMPGTTSPTTAASQTPVTSPTTTPDSPPTTSDSSPPSTATGSLCKPTGNTLIDTGVYIGPDGCGAVTLYRVNVSDTPTYVLDASFAIDGSDRSMEITNAATNSTDTRRLFVGDPDFILYVGAYDLGGLEVTPGTNELSYRIWGALDLSETTIAEGTFTISVATAESSGS